MTLEKENMEKWTNIRSYRSLSERANAEAVLKSHGTACRSVERDDLLRANEYRLYTQTGGDPLKFGGPTVYCITYIGPVNLVV